MSITELRLRKAELELIVDTRKAELAELENELRDVNDGLVNALATVTTKMMIRSLTP